MLPPRAHAPHAEQGAHPDAAVRSTDSDALVSRASAAALGYLADPFSSLFLSPQQRRAVDRRPPLIHIGTHARTWAVDSLVARFLDRNVGPHHPVQVLSLGAGTDTRFWRLRKQWADAGKDWNCARWVEVDFPEATTAKARTVSTKPDLRSALGGDVKIEQGGLALSSPLYTLLPGDLRSLSALSESLLSPSTSPTYGAPLSPSLPTLLLVECVLVYLESAATDALLSWFASTWGADGGAGGAIVEYDPFGLEDQFGAVMRRNLAVRSISLPGASSTPSLASLTERLRRAGVRGETGALSVRQIRDRCIDADEVERVARIEQLDEVEELNLVLEHYAVAWGNLRPSSSEGEDKGGIRLERRR
ncbi:leucine carboxy methyltransferase [Rhodotorula paludigena]|uniref:leucine carboxy methyltransferase n=1 Tax=Rhodotorula paludigena TaxID=86838 RepID=UPI00316C36D9